MSDHVNGNGRSAARPRLRQWLFDPFTFVAGGGALAAGLVAIVIAGVIGALTGTHLDGVLDFHLSPSRAIWVAPVESIIDWLCLSIVLFVAGKIASRTAFRVIDLFGTQALARWPSVIVVIAGIAPPFRRFLTALAASVTVPGSAQALPVGDGIVFGLVAVVSIAAIVWMVALMYRSFALCCNLKGARAALTFVIGLLIAEAMSKAALWPLLRP
jgi:hypothetical protein